MLVIVADSLAATHVSALGHVRPTTPRFDAFAGDSVHFERTWSAAAWTLPSVASLFTSRLQEEHGARDDELVIITADHGCDPSWKGSDHTRERIPVFGIGPGMSGGDVGLRPTFADIGETLAQHLIPEALPALADFIAGVRDVAWEAPAINALIKTCIGAPGLKMPKLAMPLRVLLTGQAHTPSVDAVIALFPRELVLKRLSVATHG